jgi:hypothetical protein
MGCSPRLTHWVYALHADGIAVYATNPGTVRHCLLGRRAWHDLKGIAALGNNPSARTWAALHAAAPAPPAPRRRRPNRTGDR